jgi:hypothetical protein
MVFYKICKVFVKPNEIVIVIVIYIQADPRRLAAGCEVCIRVQACT